MISKHTQGYIGYLIGRFFIMLLWLIEKVVSLFSFKKKKKVSAVQVSGTTVA